MTIESIRIPGKLSEQEFSEVRRLVLPRLYWPKILLSNWYGLVLLLALIWGTMIQFLHKDASHAAGLALVWLVVGGIVGWAFYSTKRGMEKEYRTLAKTLPDFLTIARDGLHFDGPTGARAFNPWSHFSRWREGEQVILLHRSLSGGFTMIPVGGLLPADRERLRTLLRLYVVQI